MVDIVLTHLLTDSQITFFFVIPWRMLLAPLAIKVKARIERNETIVKDRLSGKWEG